MDGVFADVLDDLVDLVLPRRCVGCGALSTALCPRCGALEPVEIDLPGLRVVAAAPYQDGLRTALLAYKERGRRDLARPLRTLLRAAVAGLDCPGAVLVPVPSSSAARRARGGDHVRRLTGRAGVRPVLRLVRAVHDSAGLDTAGRAANLAGAMLAVPPSRPRPAVLVDDIVTTGATLREAAGALRAAGWTVGGAAVVAATQKRVGAGFAQRPLFDHTAPTPGTQRQPGLA